jgi:hypothetical protein
LGSRGPNPAYCQVLLVVMSCQNLKLSHTASNLIAFGVYF